MHPAATWLLTLSFSAVMGVASVQAQAGSADFDGPIATGPAEVFAPPPASIVDPANPTAAVAQVDLTQPRETVTAAAVAATQTPQAEALASAARAEMATEADNVVELGGNAELAGSTMRVGEAGGGLLRTNPSLQRPNRRPMGLKFKF